jgi:hypothetical protein
MVPSWMNENNGIWINNQNLLVDVIADYIQNWLEDNISPELHSEMEKTSNGLVDQENFDKTVVTTFENMISKRLESFTEQLNKLEIVE